MPQAVLILFADEFNPDGTVKSSEELRSLITLARGCGAHRLGRTFDRYGPGSSFCLDGAAAGSRGAGLAQSAPNPAPALTNGGSD